MKQQINLFQEQFRERQAKYPARQLAGLTMVILALALVVNVVYAVLIHKAEQRHMQLTEQEQQQGIEIQSLTAKLEAQSVDPTLLDTVAQANRQLLAMQQVLNLLEQQDTQAPVLFSNLLSGLARRHVQGLWFEQIAIDRGGEYLYFQGKTLNAGLLPEFISRLKEEAVYNGRQFETMAMRREQENDNSIAFILSTQHIDEKQLFSEDTVMALLGDIGHASLAKTRR